MAGKTGIRGEQIKDGSIDSVDIASGSIKAGELSEKVTDDQISLIQSQHEVDSNITLTEVLENLILDLGYTGSFE